MSEKYDVVIIGSGIGGLVCGCYLAKEGLKVLIVEQHDKPGGCCTSFTRKGYRFDVGVHYIGSLREKGILSRILKEIRVLDRMKFLSADVLDRVVIPGRTIHIMRNIEETKEEISKNFRKEAKNIERFFNFILNDDLLKVMSKTRNLNFEALLNEFFSDYELKAFLSTFLGNIGLPPSTGSALVSAIILREFVFDGGYYPKGGMQVLPDMLVESFKEYGGDLLLSSKVSNILTKNGCVCGVSLSDQRTIRASYVVSNADATQTFKDLLDCNNEEDKKINSLTTSLSAFVIYLGLKCKLSNIPKHFITWHFSTYDIEKCYSRDTKLIGSNNISYLLCTFPSLIDPSIAPSGKSIVRIFAGAKSDSHLDWGHHKEEVCGKILNKFNCLFPGLIKSIEVKEVGTPDTFHRYTLNRNGALFGWAAKPSQVNKSIFPSRTSIKNLYLAGHWVTNGIGQSGIATVAFSGKSAASLILKKYKREIKE